MRTAHQCDYQQLQRKSLSTLIQEPCEELLQPMSGSGSKNRMFTDFQNKQTWIWGAACLTAKRAIRWSGARRRKSPVVMLASQLSSSILVLTISPKIWWFLWWWGQDMIRKRSPVWSYMCNCNICVLGNNHWVWCIVKMVMIIRFGTTGFIL